MRVLKFFCALFLLFDFSSAVSVSSYQKEEMYLTQFNKISTVKVRLKYYYNTQ